MVNISDGGGCSIGDASGGDVGGGGRRWSDDMRYQCFEVPGNIRRENQIASESTGVFRCPGGAMVRVMGGPWSSNNVMLILTDCPVNC